MLRPAIFFASALLILLGGATSEARKRPTVGGPDACIGYDCEGGLICSCCYDDGCWICDALAPGSSLPGWQNCEWDPAFRKKGVTKISPGSGVLDPGTGNPRPPSFNPKPYSLPGGTGTFSK
jgi:hypothetical protein